MVEASGLAGSYMDAKLEASPRLYAQFIQRCKKLDMIGFTRRPKCVQGVFFVRWKDGRSRFILDCRKANQYFVDPPGCELITGEELGELDILILTIIVCLQGHRCTVDVGMMILSSSAEMGRRILFKIFLLGTY